MASLKIGDTAPDFEADTTEGRISFHDWIGDSWAVLFSHPKDFTPVCTTELGYMAKIKPEFDRRNVKIIGLSVDSTGDHEGWARDIEETQGTAPNYPIIARRGLRPLEGVRDARRRRLRRSPRPDGSRQPDGPQRVRDRTRQEGEADPRLPDDDRAQLRRGAAGDRLAAADREARVSTPVNWKQGDDVIIAGSVSNDEAHEIWPDGWEEPKPYIRIVAQPR